MARARRAQLLLAGELEAHGPARAQGQHPAQVLDEDLLLAAEAAADARLDHADAADGDAEQGRDDAADVERHLGGGAHHQAVVLVEPGDGDVRLDGGLLHVGHAVGALEDALRLREAPSRRCPPRRRSPRPGCGAGSLMPEASGWSWMTGAPGAIDCSGSRMAGRTSYSTLDRVAGPLRELRVLRRHHRHPVAHEAHLGVEHHRVVGRGLRPALAGGGVGDARHVLVGEHGGHARAWRARGWRRCGRCGRGRGASGGCARAASPAARCRRRTSRARWRASRCPPAARTSRRCAAASAISGSRRRAACSTASTGFT